MEDCQKQNPLMKNLFSALFLICLALSCGVCEAKYSPKRMGNQIYVTFDMPGNIAMDEGVRFYKKCPDPDVKLDVYYPKDVAGNNLPCILIIHGGGWSMGNEKKFGMMAAYLASNGYVVACTTYRLLPEYPLNACVEDSVRALYWLRNNAKKYGGNPDKIGVTGGSAGGHLSALLAVCDTKKMFPQIFSDGTDHRVQAAVPMAPVTDMTRYGRLPGANAEKISPLLHVGNDSPPMLLLHCERDPVVPVSESQKMKEAYDKLGLKCEMILYDAADHAFWNTKPVDPLRLRSWNDALNFFDKILKQ